MSFKNYTLETISGNLHWYLRLIFGMTFIFGQNSNFWVRRISHLTDFTQLKLVQAVSEFWNHNFLNKSLRNEDAWMKIAPVAMQLWFTGYCRMQVHLSLSTLKLKLHKIPKSKPTGNDEKPPNKFWICQKLFSLWNLTKYVNLDSRDREV